MDLNVASDAEDKDGKDLLSSQQSNKFNAMNVIVFVRAIFLAIVTAVNLPGDLPSSQHGELNHNSLRIAS